ncbi:MAG: type II toxin-antitoxin system HipA family toxin [Lachnospiraceae bacterium]|nr:type II toxin-antitoxin system HipA family toxin [Lachnospiraceae bacterium]
MRTLNILIEINGEAVPVGTITGTNGDDAVFSYAEEYRFQKGRRPISVALPFEAESFTPRQTHHFFDGLLPEGFTRRSVAAHLHLDAEDYLSILAALGGECLGAIRVVEKEHTLEPARYERLSVEQVRALAAEGTSKTANLIAESHLSLTGASGKAGLYLEPNENVWYQPFGDAPSTHIVKQSHIRLEEIVVNEQLCLMTAGRLGIPVPESFIINLGNAKEEDVLFATKRYDREDSGPEGKLVSGLPRPNRLHQEDFSQALGISAANKYERDGKQYLADCFELLRNVSENPIADQLQLWKQLLFDYLIGNTDNHIKNISLLYSADMHTVRLAPAYDILSTAIYPRSTRDMAIRIGGAYRLDEIDRPAIQQAAAEAGLGRGMALSCLDKMIEKLPQALAESAEVLRQAGFWYAERLADRILENGGISSWLS